MTKISRCRFNHQFIKRCQFLALAVLLIAVSIGCSGISSIQSLPSLSEPRSLLLNSRASGSEIAAIAVSPNGKTLVVTGLGEPLQLWDKQSGQKLRTFRPGSYDALQNPIAYSPDSKTLASGGPKSRIELWDVQSGDLQKTLVGHTKPVTVIAFSRDGQFLASGGYDKKVQVWNVKTGKLRYTFTMPHEILEVMFSQDSSVLMSADLAGTVQQWNMQTGKLLQILANPENDVSVQGIFYPVAFSSDGKLMARGDMDKAIRIWSLETGVLERVLGGHREPTHAVTFSPNNQILATAGGSEQREVLTGGNFHDLRLWDVQTGSLLGKSGDKEYITSLAFDSDGNTLITGGSDNKLLLWNLGLLRHQVK